MAQQIFSCEIWNSEQRTGEWLLPRKLFGTFFTSNWLFSWMIVRWVLRLPDSEDRGEGGEGDFFDNWFSPENGFSPKMASPGK